MLSYDGSCVSQLPVVAACCVCVPCDSGLPPGLQDMCCSSHTTPTRTPHRHGSPGPLPGCWQRGQASRRCWWWAGSLLCPLAGCRVQAVFLPPPPPHTPNCPLRPALRPWLPSAIASSMVAAHGLGDTAAGAGRRRPDGGGWRGVPSAPRWRHPGAVACCPGPWRLPGAMAPTAAVCVQQLSSAQPAVCGDKQWHLASRPCTGTTEYWQGIGFSHMMWHIQPKSSHGERTLSLLATGMCCLHGRWCTAPYTW